MRIPYWNISYGILIDTVALVAVIVFVFGLHGHWKRIRLGKVRIRSANVDHPGKIGPVFVYSLLKNGILGAKLYKKIFTGIAHGFLFWGMLVLALGTSLVVLNLLFGLPVFEGIFNRWFMSFFLDLAGLLALLGCSFSCAKMVPSRAVDHAQGTNRVWRPDRPLGGCHRHWFSGGGHPYRLHRAGSLLLCWQFHGWLAARRRPFSSSHFLVEPWPVVYGLHSIYPLLAHDAYGAGTDQYGPGRSKTRQQNGCDRLLFIR